MKQWDKCVVYSPTMKDPGKRATRKLRYKGLSDAASC